MSDNKNIPEHIAIIPDGNRRFAKQKSKLPWEGHRAGAKVFEELLKWCKEAGVKEVSFWAASTENITRKQKEVDFLIKLFIDFCNKFMKDYPKKKDDDKMQIKFIGDLSVFPEDLVEKFKKIEDLTKDDSNYKLNMLVNYGGRWELTQAAKCVAQKVKDGKLNVDNITPEEFSKHLKLVDEPDLIIRTGQARLSGLMPWQCIYSEIMFLPDKLWPEFSKQDFNKCLEAFSKIKRNYGK